MLAATDHARIDIDGSLEGEWGDTTLTFNLTEESDTRISIDKTQ